MFLRVEKFWMWVKVAVFSVYLQNIFLYSSGALGGAWGGVLGLGAFTPGESAARTATNKSIRPVRKWFYCSKKCELESIYMKGLVSLISKIKKHLNYLENFQNKFVNFCLFCLNCTELASLFVAFPFSCNMVGMSWSKIT